jgi:hypothetical protein
MSGVRLDRVDVPDEIAYCEQNGAKCQGALYEDAFEGATTTARKHTQRTGHRSSAVKTIVRWYEPATPTETPVSKTCSACGRALYRRNAVLVCAGCDQAWVFCTCRRKEAR